MRKIFTFLCAALMSVGMFATTEVTITQNDFPQNGRSFTKDGVTVSAGMIDRGYGNIMRGGSFSTTLGNFTQIEVSANDVHRMSGEGWSGDSHSKTWTGNASSVSFSGDISGNGQGVTLKFTIEAATVAVTGVTLNQNEAQMTVGGETLTLTATVNPNNATDQSVSWSTSDANVATVENGVVTAVAAGNATITVTTTDGSFTATCAVTVTAPEPEPAGEVITWDSDDLNTFPEYLLQGESKTIKGITVTVNQGNLAAGNSQVGFNPNGSNDAFTFSTELGNFTKIECTTLMVTGSLGEGWESATWTGNANSVNFGNAGSFLVVSSITFTIEPSGGETAVDNIQIDKAQSTKLIRDGQLLIEKNGKIYNVQGVEVK